MKVDFKIIGAMKCGTSSLSAALAGHPDICFSRPKEPQFFSEVTNWREQLQEYHKLFKHKKARLHGEGSTNYTKALSRKTEVWKELYEYNKDLKLIYLVRHPVERAVSQYLHGYQRGFIQQSFPVALYKSELLSIGRYYYQIFPFIEQFGRDNILILKFEDFVKDNRTTLNQVATFLDIDNGPFENLGNISRNVGNERRVMTNMQQKKIQKYNDKLGPFFSKIMVREMREWMVRKNEKRLEDFVFSLTSAEEEKILSYSRLDILNLQPLVPFDISDYLVPAMKGKYKPGVEIHPFRHSDDK